MKHGDSIRDLTQDTNTDTVYTHPTTQQCSNVNAAKLNGLSADDLVTSVASKLSLKICSGSTVMTYGKSYNYASATMEFEPKAVIVSLGYRYSDPFQVWYTTISFNRSSTEHYFVPISTNSSRTTTTERLAISWSGTTLDIKYYTAYSTIYAYYIAFTW